LGLGSVKIIIDENNRKIAVQIPIEDFEKIEQFVFKSLPAADSIHQIYGFRVGPR
jgi:flagellar assembly factor FliW